MAKKIEETTFTEALAASSRAFLSIIPAGGIFTELIELKGNLQAARLSAFLEAFHKELAQKLGREVQPQDFVSEDFCDAFTSIVKEVINTKSDEKKTRFRKLLLNQFVAPSKDYLFDKFVQLLAEIDDLQILILEKIATRDERHVLRSIENLDTLFDPPTRHNMEFEFGKQPPKTITIKIGAEDITFERSHFHFLGLDLVSKGLLTEDLKRDSRAFRLDSSHGYGYAGGADELTIMKEQLKELSENLQKRFDETYSLSHVAKKFLEFIKSD